MSNELYIETQDGESISERRRRVANAIIDKLEKDDLLRKEVASQLNIGQELLDLHDRTRHPILYVGVGYVKGCVLDAYEPI